MIKKSDIHAEIRSLSRSTPLSLTKQTKDNILNTGLLIFDNEPEENEDMPGFFFEQWAASSASSSTSDNDILSKVDSTDGAFSIEGRKSKVEGLAEGSVTVKINDKNLVDKYKGKVVEIYNPKTGDILACARVEGSGRVRSVHDNWDKFREMFQKFVAVDIREKE